MLKNYNVKNASQISDFTLATQYFDFVGSSYWIDVYRILEQYPDKKAKVIEIGCGLGDIIAIPLHLGYVNVVGYERDELLAQYANKKTEMLFGQRDIVIKTNYSPEMKATCDVLIMVNCTYDDWSVDKKSYLKKIHFMFESCGRPDLFLLELIDSSYIRHDGIFPDYARYSQKEISQEFEDMDVSSQLTYVYPKNKSTKRLYRIKKR